MKWLNLSADERQNAVKMFGENFQESAEFWRWYDFGRRPDGTYDLRRVRRRESSGCGLPKNAKPGW